jgi:hypothetical protein
MYPFGKIVETHRGIYSNALIDLNMSQPVTILAYDLFLYHSIDTWTSGRCRILDPQLR